MTPTAAIDSRAARGETRVARQPPAAEQPRASGDRAAAAPRTEYEQLFLSHLDTVGDAVAFLARRYRLTRDQAEEFASLANLRLIEGDYAVLRKFQHRSSLRTYLTVVIHRVFLDYRAARWGKWRSSAVARREGQVAVLLERLTAREGVSFDRACAVMESAHGMQVDRQALEGVFNRLPARHRRYFVSEDLLSSLPDSGPGPEERALASRANAGAVARTSQALAGALAGLTPEDLRLLRWRFVEGLTVREIARRFDSHARDARPLYRRLQRMLEQLRTALETRGVRRADVIELLGSPDVAIPPLLGRRGPATRSIDDDAESGSTIARCPLAHLLGESHEAGPSNSAGGHAPCD